ncbi:chromate efflux transporter [Pseudoalteromonas piscicida]|uniref:Chorismate-binding protein n=1 Tax=Pseudoalteromonas piscicida TaxID=43662 RepID=A0A2A5JKR9_PSEO7|nr:chromate efflux transporter [Pseudoalteromonas piscicida]PCK30040.1 chorismate-binding protein [Pseudoalteromonas piscicida]
MFLKIFYQFFLLGCTSFGGPAAHLGFFKKHFVDNLKWISSERYANMISLSQILPGPGSSQVGFAIGLEKAGVAGGVAAFLGFTLPSFLLMVLLALTAEQLSGSALAIIDGLKLFAVVIVADAVLGMAKSFCKTTALKIVTFIATLVLLFLPSLGSQLGILVVLAVIACFYSFSNAPSAQGNPHSGTNWSVFALFIGLFLLTFAALPTQLFAEFYQAGALVFGGGHVVLPLLQTSVDNIAQETFLTAYAAAQAIPGPMFTIASFLGATAPEINPILGAIIATVAIFLPGLLLMWAFNQQWQSLIAMPRFASISAALNAGVVGILAAAFYQPIWLSAVHSWLDMVAVVLGFVVLKWLKPAIWQLLIAFVVFGLVAGNV